MAEFIGNEIIKLTEVDSTNNYATELLSKTDCQEGTIVVASEQVEGRGQVNNSWESESGKNLLLSVVLKPKFLPIQYQFLISKIAALSLCDVVAEITVSARIKWPNDLYVGEQKIAGILIENSIMGSSIETSILGIGLNVNQVNFMSDAPNPVSLIHFSKENLDLSKVLKRVIEKLNYWYGILQQGDVEKIDSAYKEKLFRVGEVAQYKDSSGVFEGRIRGVSEIGQLEIVTEQHEIRRYHFKEVEFIFEK